MKIAPGTLCMACGTEKATTANGTVPLCAKCARLAKGQERGVKLKGDGDGGGKRRPKKASASA